MSDNWVIGDIHGCYNSLRRLIDKINPSCSTSIFIAGDLINRGPHSAQTLNFLMDDCPIDIQCILGNHDLAFISFYHKIFTKTNKQDCYNHLILGKNIEKWINWLRTLPLCIAHDEFTLVHAGLYPHWSIEENFHHASLLSDLLKSNNYIDELNVLWSHAASTTPSDYKLSFALNVFTRMRYVNKDKSLCLETKGLTASPTDDKQPWFTLWPKQDKTIYFGHWSAIKGHTQRSDIVCLDTGCVWKENLTAINTSTGEKIIQPYSE